MHLPAIYVESEDGVKKLRRGASIAEGSKILVVDDVHTTGRSVLETIEVVKAGGGIPAGVAVLIDRSERIVDYPCPFFAAYRVEAESFAPEEVPEWLQGIPITKPGTRPI
ncbi:MAG: Orotate phosphoribosyltransferase [Fimbriimonadaceae bacterium]|nr:Orotate phosphoribosyltransferase [Fimbriimonadaceae bacterium]